MKKKTYAVLGLGKFGISIATELAKAGAEVLAVDLSDENVHNIADTVTYAVKADVCDAEAMNSLGLSNMDGVVVAITESMDASIMATILAKEAQVPFVMSKAKDEIHKRILEKVGADRVIIPEKESGVRMAYNMLSGNFMDLVELSDRIRLIEIPIRPEWQGKTLRELNLRQKQKINILAIRKANEVVVNIDPDEKLEEGITMWITVDKADMFKLA